MARSLPPNVLARPTCARLKLQKSGLVLQSQLSQGPPRHPRQVYCNTYSRVAGPAASASARAAASASPPSAACTACWWPIAERCCFAAANLHGMRPLLARAGTIEAIRPTTHTAGGVRSGDDNSNDNNTNKRWGVLCFFFSNINVMDRARVCACVCPRSRCDELALLVVAWLSRIPLLGRRCGGLLRATRMRAAAAPSAFTSTADSIL